MKKQLLLLGISIITLTSCKNDGVKTFKQSPSDTTKTMCLYVLNNRQQFLDWTIRVTKDSFMYVKSDTAGNKVTQEKKWIRDTLYFVPVIDTLRDTQGKFILDSLGKPQPKLFWPQAPKKYIIKDFNVNINEIFSPEPVPGK